jgi:hypothetical protein
MLTGAVMNFISFNVLGCNDAFVGVVKGCCCEMSLVVALAETCK